MCRVSGTLNKRQRKPKGQSKMENPEKPATWGTQDEENTKHKHNTMFVGQRYTQTNTNNINKT